MSNSNHFGRLKLDDDSVAEVQAIGAQTGFSLHEHRARNDDEEQEEEQLGLQLDMTEIPDEFVSDAQHEKYLQDMLKFNMFGNASPNLSNSSDCSSINVDGDLQLTPFEENLITTGSSASIVLLVVLVVLFIIQFVRKVYLHCKHEKMVDEIDSVLCEKPKDLVERYNRPFVEKQKYEEQERQGADLRTLQQILERRAMEALLRGRKLQEDGPGIRKNWQLDMVPKDVWYDFSAAEVSVRNEFESISQEIVDKRYHWGPKYENNVFQFARDKMFFLNSKKQAMAKRATTQPKKELTRRQQKKLAQSKDGVHDKVNKSLQPNESPQKKSKTNPRHRKGRRRTQKKL